MNSQLLKTLFSITQMGGIILFLSTCATKKDTEFLDLNSDKIEQTLDIDQKKIDKFIVKKRPKKKAAASAKKKKTQNKQTHRNQKKMGPVSKGEKKTSLEVEKERSPYPEKNAEVFKKYDDVSKYVWKRFRPVVHTSEKFVFKVGYLGLTVGHIQMETLEDAQINGEDVYHFKGRMRSARYYSYIYTLDDTIESFIRKSDFTPLKYVLLQRESGQTVDDLQLFDRDELKTYHFYKRLKKGKKTKREIEKAIPLFFQDSFSVLHFVRGLPLIKGESFDFPIVTRGKIWTLKILVEREETIEVNGKKKRAIRLNAQTRFPGVLEKKGDIIFWYSADENKKLLKFEAEVKIGSVSGELVEYSRGQGN